MLQPIEPTVWLVDDDPDDQELIYTAFLANHPPVNVLILSDGEELLPALATCRQLPRVILLDITMPFKKGFETLQALRNTPAFAHLPVIMLTISSAEEDCQRSLNLGASQFMTKPLSYQQLRQLAYELSQQWTLI